MIKANVQGLAIAAFALLLVAANAVLLRDLVPLALGGEKAEGVVVDLRTSSDGGGQSPVVEFAPAGGAKVRVSGSGFSSPPSAAMGEKVPVLYDPANPARAKLALVQENLHALFFFCVGVLVLFAWWVMPRSQKSLWRHEPGTHRSLADSGVPAVATVLAADAAAGSVSYRIDKDPNMSPQDEARGRMGGFIGLEYSVSGGWRAPAGERVTKGAQFRAYLDPSEPGKKFYVDFGKRIGNDPYVQSFAEEMEADDGEDGEDEDEEEEPPHPARG